MGKYMRKARGTGGVAVMEVSQGPLGVRTRARALALEKSSKNLPCSEDASAGQTSSGPKLISYLELRSRRLEKFVGCGSTKEQTCHSKLASKSATERRLSDLTNSDVLDDCSSRLVRHEEIGQSVTMLHACAPGDRGRENSDENRGCFFHLEEGASQRRLHCPGLNRKPCRGRGRTPGAAHSRSNSRSNSLPRENSQGMLTRNQKRLERGDPAYLEDMVVDADAFCGTRDAENVGNSSGRDAEVEVSFGENPMDEVLHVRDSNHSRLVREGTPCSHVREVEGPGSAISLTLGDDHGTQFLPPVLLDPQALMELEIEEFFANADRVEQRRFTERYNFDPVNDVPICGRFEWIKLQPGL